MIILLATPQRWADNRWDIRKLGRQFRFRPVHRTTQDSHRGTLFDDHSYWHQRKLRCSSHGRLADMSDALVSDMNWLKKHGIREHRPNDPLRFMHACDICPPSVNFYPHCLILCGQYDGMCPTPQVVRTDVEKRFSSAEIDTKSIEGEMNSRRGSD